MKTFDSKWLHIRASDDELTLELTRAGVDLLMSSLVSSTTDKPGVRVTRWKRGEILTLASLFGDMEDQTCLSIANAWIKIDDKELVRQLLDELLYGEGEVVLKDRNRLVKGE